MVKGFGGFSGNHDQSRIPINRHTGDITMPTVFEFIDYRKYLCDVYAERKEKNRNFSHRYIAQKVGLKSSGHFAQILQGKVNMSPALSARFVDFLGLNEREADYFEHMVYYGQAKSHSEKKRHFEKLISMRGMKPRILDAGQYEYYSKWYYSAIRELLGQYRFNGDYRALSRRIVPNITPKEAGEAIELLEKLELIERRADGSYERLDRIISTGYAAEALAINNLQIEMMELAKESIDRFPKGKRNLSTLTIGVSGREYERIVEELRGFRRRVLEIAGGADVPDRLYQMNFQVFPLTELPNDDTNA